MTEKAKKLYEQLKERTRKELSAFRELMLDRRAEGIYDNAREIVSVVDLADFILDLDDYIFDRLTEEQIAFLVADDNLLERLYYTMLREEIPGVGTYNACREVLESYLEYHADEIAGKEDEAFDYEYGFYLGGEYDDEENER